MLQQTVVWALVCLGALVLSLWRPELGRVVLGAFFIVMAVGVNVVFVLLAPQGFVKLGTDAALLPAYEWGFRHIVAQVPAVFGLAVAAFEIAIGVFMLKSGALTKWALLAGMVFLVAIAPLGPWTLPNAVKAAALLVISTKRHLARSAGATA